MGSQSTAQQLYTRCARSRSPIRSKLTSANSGSLPARLREAPSQPQSPRPPPFPVGPRRPQLISTRSRPAARPVFAGGSRCEQIWLHLAQSGQHLTPAPAVTRPAPTLIHAVRHPLTDATSALPLFSLRPRVPPCSLHQSQTTNVQHHSTGDPQRLHTHTAHKNHPQPAPAKFAKFEPAASHHHSTRHRRPTCGPHRVARACVRRRARTLHTMQYPATREALTPPHGAY